LKVPFSQTSADIKGVEDSDMAETPRRRHRRLWIGLVGLTIAGVLLIAGIVFHSEDSHRHEELTPTISEVPRTHDHVQTAESAVREDSELWTCSMHPQIRLPNPGRCPICGMDLIPLATDTLDPPRDETRSLRELTLSPTARKLAEVRLQSVERRSGAVTLRMVGRVAYDERRVASISAWAAGRLEKLHVDFTGTMVKVGTPMVTLYSPELYSAQSELLQAIRTRKELERSGLASLRTTSEQAVRSAREKLRLLGLAPEQIEEVVRRGEPTNRITIPAPLNGTVVEKNGLEGMYVRTGTEIYRIADLSHLWIRMEAYESDLPWIRLGDDVSFEVQSIPGEVFHGRVSFIDPYLKEKTRTVQVRLDIPNPQGRLKPGMFVHGRLEAQWIEEDHPLVIPASAPLITGKRAVVYVAVPEKEGTYQGREIVLGPRAGDVYLVRRGLREGEQVVTHGNFKIDSALQLLAKPSMMDPEGSAPAAAHDHGPAAPTTGVRAMGDPLSSVPEAVIHQIHLVLDAYDRVTDNLREEFRMDARPSFAALSHAVDSVDDSRLSGHSLAMWNEISMLLRNDAFLGAQAKSTADIQEAFESLSSHVGRVITQFGISHGDPHAAHAVHAAPTTPAETAEKAIPISFKAQLGNLLDAYLTLHEALAANDHPSAVKSIRTMEDAARSLDMTLLDGEPHRLWMELSENIRSALRLMKQSTDLSRLRECFALFSETLAVVLKRFGVHPEFPIYRIFCPMAFNNQGALWLQKDADVRNPYYGPAMLRCGEVQEVF